ncbi:peptidoglycan-binding protein [Streptomyces sp. NPDC088387]|uniref:peptidoglycan-binding domain-containing protein n=1 Tax=Streptomyces sp. NPDC088387 TaxID=3365859 RepID=UPI0038218423
MMSSRRVTRTSVALCAALFSVALLSGAAVGPAPAAPTAYVEPAECSYTGPHDTTAVRHLQCLLRLHGHNVPVDGVMGVSTRRALLGFQQSRGLPADGVLSPRTWQELHLFDTAGLTGGEAFTHRH